MLAFVLAYTKIMKFEKVNNDKIKVTLNNADLLANDIDFHSFMSNSSETQSLFLTVLDKAERDYGFQTDNYQLKVETLALDNGCFILTITRTPVIESPSTNTYTKKKLKVARKLPNMLSTSIIYKFNTFDDFCSFVGFLQDTHISALNKFAKNSILYAYKEYYYLVFDRVNPKYPNLKSMYASITEFGTYVDYSEAFIAKLHESAKVVIKNHAIRVCAKYFL